MLAYARPTTNSSSISNPETQLSLSLNAEQDVLNLSNSSKHETFVKTLQQTTQNPSVMLANVPSSNVVSGGVSSSASMEACDERTRLLSNTPTPPPPLPLTMASTAAFAVPVVVSPLPPTTLPLVHTTTTLQPHPSHHSTNNNHNINNNNAVVVSPTAAAAASNNNNDSLTGAGAGAIDLDGDDLSEETATTAGAADSSDLSDKFPRPHTNQKKPKLNKLGTKGVGLKRVSFGSSKGSMVETLVFETPTPLSEHVEPTFGFDAADTAAAGNAATATAAAGQLQQTSHLPPVSYSDYAKVNMDDSGIEVQEESERSIVRVSIYQSSQPQQICPPAEYLLTSFQDNLDNTFSSYNCNLDYTTMTTAAMQPVVGLGPAYDRQQSTDSGWDNPFRPGGDLSREADEIVNMIRGGKPITPTEDRTIGNGNAQHGDDNCNGTAIGESVTKTNISQNQATAQNGTNSHGSKVAGTASAGATTAAATPGGGGGGGGGKTDNGVTSLAQVSKQVVPGPTSASHVVIDEKKNKKKGCCVVQ